MNLPRLPRAKPARAHVEPQQRQRAAAATPSREPISPAERASAKETPVLATTALPAAPERR